MVPPFDALPTTLVSGLHVKSSAVKLTIRCSMQCLVRLLKIKLADNKLTYYDILYISFGLLLTLSNSCDSVKL